MKRKSESKTDPEIVVPQEILAPVIFRPEPDRIPQMVPCEVCGSETRADLTERLCWVCRRLKISAWRDSEPMPAQE